MYLWRTNQQLMTDIKDEALRLLRVKGTVGRHMAKMTGISHQTLSDYRCERYPIIDINARKIIRAFKRFAKQVTPQITEP